MLLVQQEQLEHFTVSGVAADTHPAAFLCGHLDLLLYKIAAVDFLGDGVLNLDAGVHFDEIEVTVISEGIRSSPALA